MPKLEAPGVAPAAGSTSPSPTPAPSRLSRICTAAATTTPAMMPCQEMRLIEGSRSLSVSVSTTVEAARPPSP